MNERVIQFRVGVVVVAAAIITGILIMLFGEGRSFVRRQYTINLLFEKAPGVTIDTPVRKHGVLIGRVSSVELDDEADGVRLKARIDSNRKLYTNEVCVIRTSSLLGDAVLEFVPGGVADAPRNPVSDGDVLANGIVASDPLEVLTNLEGSMRSAIGSIESAANQVDSLAQNLNRALGADDDQISRILQKSEIALDKFSATMTTIDSVVGDEELNASLKRALQDLPQTLEQMRTTLSAANTTMQGFERMSQKAEQNLDNIERFTRPLGERGDDLLRNVDQTIANLDELLTQLVTFSRSLNSGEGTLGQLVHNPDLYNRLNGAAENIERASLRIEPILKDVRVFTDKIARDPAEVVRLNSLMNSKPPGTGLKYMPPGQNQGVESTPPFWK